MSATERPPLPDSSVDLARVSVVTSTPNLGSPDETGLIYRPDILAAGRLMHTTPIVDDGYLGVFSKVWASAILDQNDPGVVTSKTVVSQPRAFWFDISGACIPALLSSAPDTLLGATSLGSMLYLLGMYEDVPTLFSYRISQYGSGGGLVPVDHVAFNTSLADPAGPVDWNRGVHRSGRYIYTVGSDAQDRLFLRKEMFSEHRHPPLFLGPKGWSTSDADLDPLRDSWGEPVTSVGPVSIARHHLDWFVSTTSATLASFWHARSPRSPFFRLPRTITLDTAEDAFVHFQESVHPNPEHVDLSSPGLATGIPYVYALESADSLRTVWGLLGVPRAQI